LKFRKFRKNAKALSPVIATIILIAVTVAVSVVVAAWMGALTIGFMGNAEQASITNTVLTNKADNGIAYSEAICTVQNTGSATVTINSGNVDGNTTVWQLASPVSIAKGTSGTVTLTANVGGTNVASFFTNTAQYTIKLQTAKGNTVTSTATYTG
jgi:flagellin-like protein